MPSPPYVIMISPRRVKVNAGDAWGGRISTRSMVLSWDKSSAFVKIFAVEESLVSSRNNSALMRSVTQRNYLGIRTLVVPQRVEEGNISRANETYANFYD